MPKNDPTANFEGLYLEHIKQLSTPARIMTVAIVKKLKANGVHDADKHFGSIEKALAGAVSDLGNIPASIYLNTGDPKIDHSNLSLDDAALSAAAALIEAESEKVITELIEQLRKDNLKSVLESEREKRLVHMEIDRQAFVRRLALTWKEPLELLDLHLSLALELGGAWTKKLRGGRRKKDAELFEVIPRLHARSLQIAGEVRALLREGFADGALSRWRTIHELAVVAFFIVQEGNEMASRYLDHLDVDSYKAALGYERAASLLGHKKVSPRELASLTKTVDALKTKYGKAFTEDYGWSASSLKGKSPNFANIEEAVRLERFRPYFRLASNTVHAGPKGAYFRLGTDEVDVLLAGPSNVGLQEAARLTALSIAQITSCLLSMRPNLDSGVWTGVLLDLSNKVEEEAVRVMRRIEREERQLRSDREAKTRTRRSLR